MFEDSLVESSGRLKTKRSWTTGVSVLVQSVLLGVMILYPLIVIEGLPRASMMTFLVAPPPPPPPPPPPAPAPKVRMKPQIISNEFKAPTKIPKQIRMEREEEPPAQVAGVVGGVGVPGGQMGGVIGGIVSSVPVPKLAVQKVRVSSGVAQGLLINGPKPVYPAIARAARIQGQVILQAVISKQGTIEGLHAVSGPPMLYQAALDAVKQWRYRPYMLNGEPVEVDTQIIVNFNLNSGG